ncbi:hypothetical protein Bca4012_045109 [Brassica carinata]|uniref:Uncharacterized protein n=1 Tax=Brassica carinata TaxID=52824 RepID=A0A8X7QW37_BRACI|nr:hypothetical protein Bca52824_057433 [Brassica carinata]
MITPVPSPALTPGDRASTLASGGFFSDDLAGFSSSRRWLLQRCLAGSASAVTPFFPLFSFSFEFRSSSKWLFLPLLWDWFIFGLIRINKDDMLWIRSF